MMKWDPLTNCLTEWQVPGWPKPLSFSGWGCEVGNWFGFFAHERLGGRHCQIHKYQLPAPSVTRLESSWQVILPQAQFSLHLCDELIAPNALKRNLTVKNLAKGVSWIGDAVIRTVVPWEAGLTADIEGQALEHEDKNYYHDTEASQVALRWADGRRLTLAWEKPPEVPPTLMPNLYVRDQPRMVQYDHLHSNSRAWVLHARLLVDQPASFVYRWSRFLFWDRTALGRRVVSPPRLAHRWRAAEWKLGGRGSLYGLWPLSPDLSLNLSIIITAKG
jgi:hypothetical protein